MINLKGTKSSDITPSYKPQLSRISYTLQPLREDLNYFCRFIDGVGIFNKNEVILLGDKITCLVEHGSTDLKVDLLTNQEGYSIKEVKPNNFIYSIVEILKFKTLLLNQRLSEQKQSNDENGKFATLTLLLEDESNLELQFDYDIICTHNGSNITQEEMYSLLQNAIKIARLHTKTVSPKGTREMILTNHFAEILKEFFYFINRTLILDYDITSSNMKRCILFDKQVLEIQMNHRGGITLTSYSVNKFSYGFPDSILCTSDSLRDINEKITDYAENTGISLDRKRR